MTQDNGLDPSPSYMDLHSALDELQRAESRYRRAYHNHGARSIATGQAWDRMRKEGHRARQVLAGSHKPMRSPCAGVCSIRGGECMGCGRTPEEIQGWRGMTLDEKQAVRKRLELKEKHNGY